MALPVLDGNQTATTLSSVVTGGEHIVAHSVVSLGSQAILEITGAVSGSVVSISNFPSTQTIAGTVTANNSIINDYFSSALEEVGTSDASYAVRVQGYNASPLPVSGTVTANAILQNANAMAQAFIDESDAYGAVGVNIVNSSGNIGVVGTVTAAAPNGSLTTRFGTPTTANVSFATSAVTNANRKYLLIQNVTTGSNVITVGIGFTPTTTQGIQLTAGAGITFESSYIPTGQIFVLSSVTASNFTILEA